jgi:nanoRNase/pAp phosphatase (c-di-AMP/oligoRNAs hydrolase)
MAAVAGKKNGKLEVSLRCNRDFTEKTGIHLGKDIAMPLGQALGGVGGGHAAAAGVNAKGEVEDALDKCFKLLQGKILTNA